MPEKISPTLENEKPSDSEMKNPDGIATDLEDDDLMEFLNTASEQGKDRAAEKKNYAPELTPELTPALPEDQAQEVGNEFKEGSNILAQYKKELQKIKEEANEIKTMSLKELHSLRERTQDMARKIPSNKRGPLLKVMAVINEAISKHEAKLKEEKTAREKEADEKTAREIFKAILEDPTYLKEIFNGEDITITDLENVKRDEDFLIKLGEGEVLICKVRVTPKAEKSDNKIEWFEETKELTINSEGDKKPIYVNLILQKENLENLKKLLAEDKHSKNLVDSIRVNLEGQLTVILLSEIRRIINSQGGSKEAGGYSEKDERHFKEILTYKKTDFSAAAKELTEYIEEFPQMKNDPVISNTLQIMGRLDTKSESDEKSEETA